MVGCARRAAETAPAAHRPAVATPAGSSAAQDDLAAPPAAAGAKAGHTHGPAHSHEHGEGCSDACCADPDDHPAPTAVFAPPSETPTIRRGDAKARQVAITFDGAPVPDSTTLLVALLRAYDAKATFFLVGDRLEGNRRQVDAIVAEKHLIGNQTMAGKPLAGLSREQMSRQIKACDDLLEHIAGQLYAAARPQMRLLRPPDGRSDQSLTEVAKSLGYTVVLWSVDGTPTKGESGERLAERICSQVQGGSIIRLQDGPEATVEALPRILEYLAGNGYECVTVDEMLG